MPRVPTVCEGEGATASTACWAAPPATHSERRMQSGLAERRWSGPRRGQPIVWLRPKSWWDRQSTTPTPLRSGPLEVGKTTDTGPTCGPWCSRASSPFVAACRAPLSSGVTGKGRIKTAELRCRPEVLSGNRMCGQRYIPRRPSEAQRGGVDRSVESAGRVDKTLLELQLLQQLDNRAAGN